MEYYIKIIINDIKKNNVTLPSTNKLIFPIKGIFSVNIPPDH